MMYILAYAPSGKEFATADAINALGALAVVPRKVIFADGLPGGYGYRPFLPRYMFLAIDPLTWSRIIHWQHPLRDDTGKVLQPPGYCDEILPRTWVDFQGFAERAEMAAQIRIEQFEAGNRVAGYKPGDRIRILGDLLDGQLKDRLATFVKLDGQGHIIATPDGVEMMGKPIRVTLAAHDVEGIAAE
jgi:hypothetical protein